MELKNRQKLQDGLYELGYYGYSSFSDHTMYDDEITLYDKIGWGADAGISFNIPLFFKQKSSPLAYKILKNKLKFFIGGFFFNQSQKAQNATFTFNKIKSTQGISTELSYDITRHITFEVKDNYDNQMHNTIMTGIRATFGGIKDNKNTENSVYSKLLCPIVNNIGNILSGTVEPTKKKSISIIRRGIELNNVYFFGKETPSDTSNGSYENPYSASELTQSTLTELSNSNAINSQVNIFLLSGKNYINAKDLVLAKNESIYGRCNNFKEASSDNSPIIYGQLTLKGGSYSHTQVVQGIHMKNNGNTSNSGIKIDGENISNIKIDDVKIGMNSTTSNYYTYTTGILVENGANLSKGISNSTIWATGDSVASDFGITAGIEVKNASVGDIKNNTISIGTYDCNANLWGIYLEDNSSKNMNIGNITDNNITVNTDKYVYYNNSNRGIYANAETETSNNVELNIGDIEENKISIKEPTSEEYKRYNNDGMQFDGNATNGKAYINVGNIINNNINVAYASSNGWSDDITAYANSKNTYITVGNILNNEIKGNGDGIRNINSKIDNSESSIVNQNNFTGNFKKIYSTT